MNGNREKTDGLARMKQELRLADAVLIGAGSGLSVAAGFTYSGERFNRYFKDFIEAYQMTDMYSAGFYPFQTQEEKWAYWSRHIYYNRYDLAAGKAYVDLYDLVKEKDYFVLTTNVDHQFWEAGFKDQRIFATQGDYGLFQCACACHKRLYDNEEKVRSMVKEQKDLKIPGSLVPKCPVCGGNMEVNLRCDSYFVEDEAWYQAAGRYDVFLKESRNKRVLFLELGVGLNTPSIIKYPFWNMAHKWKQAFYICINKGQAWAPEELSGRTLCLDLDIAYVLDAIKSI